MRCNIPGFLATLAKELPQYRSRVSEPLVAVDENLNSRKLATALASIIASGGIAGVDPLWYERRKSATGEAHYSPGSLSKRTEALLGLGSREGWSWDEESVVCTLVAHFGVYDRLILLTADHGNDPKGLLRLLQDVVRPRFEMHHADRLGLWVLGQAGNTALPVYIRAVTERIVSGRVAVGYPELWI